MWIKTYCEDEPVSSLVNASLLTEIAVHNLAHEVYGWINEQESILLYSGENQKAAFGYIKTCLSGNKRVCDLVFYENALKGSIE